MTINGYTDNTMLCFNLIIYELTWAPRVGFIPVNWSGPGGLIHPRRHWSSGPVERTSCALPLRYNGLQDTPEVLLSIPPKVA